MKRQSAAEAALTKQVRILNDEIQCDRLQMRELEARIETKSAIRNGLESEIERLRYARQLASQQRKPE